MRRRALNQQSTQRCVIAGTGAGSQDRGWPSARASQAQATTCSTGRSSVVGRASFCPLRGGVFYGGQDAASTCTSWRAAAASRSAANPGSDCRRLSASAGPAAMFWSRLDDGVGSARLRQVWRRALRIATPGASAEIAVVVLTWRPSGHAVEVAGDAKLPRQRRVTGLDTLRHVEQLACSAAASAAFERTPYRASHAPPDRGRLPPVRRRWVQKDRIRGHGFLPFRVAGRIDPCTQD